MDYVDEINAHVELIINYLFLLLLNYPHHMLHPAPSKPS